jgi:tagatose-1,6-bisphosphate aldolase non-catalytic subunit AgaZ/GatZ
MDEYAQQLADDPELGEQAKNAMITFLVSRLVEQQDTTAREVIKRLYEISKMGPALTTASEAINFARATIATLLYEPEVLGRGNGTNEGG